MGAPLAVPLCGILDIDARGLIVGANGQLLRWIDRDLADIVGQETSFVLDLRLTGDSGTPTDASLRHRSGTIRSVVIGSFGSGDDGITRIAVFDLSPGSPFERAFQVGEQRSARGQRRLEILLSASVGFAEARDEQTVADLLSEVAARSFAATAVSVHLDRDGRTVHVAGVNPLAEHWPAGIAPTGARTLSGREVVVVLSPDDAERFNPGVGIDAVFRAAGIQASVASPIVYEGHAIGSMICYFDRPRQFDDEAVPLAEALANQAGQAIARVRLEETVRRASMLDQVTGLPNRRRFEEDLAVLLPGAAESVAVLFIDLDGFKSVNDQLGHTAGDRLLRQVGQRLQEEVRDIDAIGRFGGDEFIAIAAVPDHDAAAALAERIRETIARPYPGVTEHLSIAASIGVAVRATHPDRTLVADQLIRAADHAMYAAKSAGGNRVSMEDVG